MNKNIYLKQRQELLDRRAYYLQIIAGLGISPLTVFGFVNLAEMNLLTAAIELIFAVVLLGTVYYAQQKKNITTLSIVCTVVLCMVVSTLLFTGGIGGSAIIWLYTVPIVLYFLNGLTVGSFLSALYICVLVDLVLLDRYGHITLFYEQLFLRQFIVSYIVITFMVAGYELTSDRNRQRADTAYLKLSVALEESNRLFESRKKAEKQLENAVVDLEKKNVKMKRTQFAIANLLEDVQSEKDKMQKLSTEDEAMLKGLQEAIIATDKNGNITKVNARTLQVIGYSLSQLKGKKLFDIVQLTDNKQTPIAHKDSILTKAVRSKKVVSEQYGILKKDGKSIFAQVTVAPYIINGQLSGSVITIQDISHQVEVDRAKSEFVSLASHQLRTPLTAIGWYAELLEGIPAIIKSKQAMKQVLEVKKAHKRMAALVNALLNVSRIELGTFMIEPEEVNFEELVDTVLDETSKLAKTKKQKIVKKINIKEDLYLDSKLTYILLQNLLTNAIKYTQEGGTITIAADKTKSKIEFSVQDNGYGIPKAQQDKLFTKLFRADNVQKLDTDGTGLGMYIVKAIVDSAGGKIEFKSQKDKGTKFTLSFPAKGMVARTGARGLSADS